MGKIRLSRREKEVAKMIAMDFKAEEIADKLNLSKRTIESYIQNIISKLEVRSRVGIAVYAVKNGLDRE